VSPPLATAANPLVPPIHHLYCKLRTRNKKVCLGRTSSKLSNLRKDINCDQELLRVYLQLELQSLSTSFRPSLRSDITGAGNFIYKFTSKSLFSACEPCSHLLSRQHYPSSNFSKGVLPPKPGVYARLAILDAGAYDTLPIRSGSAVMTDAWECRAPCG
jgi:hypothetical protein